MARLGRFFFRYRNTVGPAILVLVLLFSTPRHVAGHPGIDAVVDVLGICIVLLGLGVRAATIGYEYIVRGGRNRQVFADRLVQGGVYAHTRNPMYLGNALIALGCIVVVNAPQFYLVALPLIVLVYASIIAAEEAYLRERFGAEFDAYCGRVNRIVPRLSGFRESVKEMRFNWRRVLVKDYTTMFASLLAVLFLSAWDDYEILGAEALPSVAIGLAIIVPWTILYLTVWRLKKTRGLEGDRPQPKGARQTR
jgi:protein-S-isoprenylcysteine O-methyltransferase Ste14